MRSLPDWSRPLPHIRAGIKSKNLKGNPVYARDLLQFVKNEDKCKIGEKSLLSDKYNIQLDKIDSKIRRFLLQ